MVMREVKFPHDKYKEIMSKLNDKKIVETLQNILQVVTEILSILKSKDERDVSVKEKQLLND